MKERIYPRKGTNKDLFERLVEYISYFDKEWINKIEGATDEEIEELENIFKKIDKNFKLPEQLYIFLKNIGRNNGKLLYEDGLCICDIDDMLEFNNGYISNMYLGNYPNYTDIEYIVFGANFIYTNYMLLNKEGNLIGISSESPFEIGTNFLLKSIIEEDNREVFTSLLNNNPDFLEEYNYWQAMIKAYKEANEFEKFKEKAIKTNFCKHSKDDFKFYKSSIETYLFQLAFRKYENFSNFIENKIIKYDKNKVKNIKQIVENILKKYNVEKAWFSDEASYCGYGNMFNIYIFLYQDDFKFNFSIRGEDKELIEQIYNDLQKAFE